MSKRVLKYTLETYSGAVNRIRVTQGFKPLHAGLGPGGVPCIWMEVDEAAPPITVSVRIVGTGNEVPEGSEYAGSFVEGDTYVWHVYLGRN